MLNLMNRLWRDESGVILSAEIVIVGSLLVVGMITGLTCLQEAVNGELRDVAGAIGALDQSFSFSAHRKSGFNGQCCAYTAGSAFANCENQPAAGCHDIAGCRNTCLDAVIASPAECRPVENPGCCEGCGGAEAFSAEGCSGCGNAPCTSSAFSGATGVSGSRCLDTGVPGMKVTEWPAVPESDNATINSDAPLADACPTPGSGDISGCLPGCPTDESSGQRYHDVIIPDHVW